MLECNAGSGQVLGRFRFAALPLEEIHVGGCRSEFLVSKFIHELLCDQLQDELDVVNSMHKSEHSRNASLHFKTLVIFSQNLFSIGILCDFFLCVMFSFHEA